MTADADASSPMVLRHARPGERVSSDAVTGARACTVRAGRARTTTDVTGAAQVRVSLRVARRARAGVWRISIACAPLPARSIALAIRRSSHRPSTTGPLVAGAIRVEVTARTRRPTPPSAVAQRAPAAAVPMFEADALARAQADWGT